MESIFGELKHHQSNVNGGGVKIEPNLSKAVETCAKEVAVKFNRLNQLIEQLNNEEHDIREQMKKNCSDLREEVDQMESKQRKIKEAFKSLMPN